MLNTSDEDFSNDPPLLKKTKVLKQELRKAQTIILQQQKIIEQQNIMQQQKKSIDILKEKVTVQLRMENHSLHQQILALQETIEQTKSENAKLKKSNQFLQTAYDQAMSELNNQLLNATTVDKASRIKQIKQMAQEVSLQKITTPSQPPPPPPPPPQAGTQKVQEALPTISLRKKPKVPTKIICWEAIPKGKLKGTLWEKLNDENIQLDWDYLEEQFRYVESSKNQSQGVQQRVAQVKEVFLSFERQRSVELAMMKHKLTSKLLVEALLKVDLQVLTTEVVESLMKCLPREGELSDLTSAKFDKAALSKPELFLYEVYQLESAEKRIRVIDFAYQFQEVMEAVESKLGLMAKKCIEMRTNPQLIMLFIYILAVGNFLNGNSTRGIASGFKLDSFEKTQMMKAKDNETSLLQYIITKLENNPYVKCVIYEHELKSENQMFSFKDYEEFRELQKYSLMQIQKMEIFQLKQGFQLLQELLQLKEAKLVAHFQPFAEQVKEQLSSLGNLFIDAQTEYEKLCDYFGEPYNNYESEKFFVKVFNLLTLCKNAKCTYVDRQNKLKQLKIESQTKQQLQIVRQSILMNQSSDLRKQLSQLKTQSLATLLKAKKAMKSKKS